MKILPKTILLATLIVAPLASMAAERLLAQGTEYQVTHNTAGACGKSAAITIRSEDFEFFTRNSSQLQNILDGARAMIEFQCGRIEAIARANSGVYMILFTQAKRSAITTGY